MNQISKKMLIPDYHRFESQLPVVFDHFNTIYRSINARLKAEQVRVS